LITRGAAVLDVLPLAWWKKLPIWIRRSRCSDCYNCWLWMNFCLIFEKYLGNYARWFSSISPQSCL